MPYRCSVVRVVSTRLVEYGFAFNFRLEQEPYVRIPPENLSNFSFDLDHGIDIVDRSARMVCDCGSLCNAALLARCHRLIGPLGRADQL